MNIDTIFMTGRSFNLFHFMTVDSILNSNNVDKLLSVKGRNNPQTFLFLLRDYFCSFL